MSALALHHMKQVLEGRLWEELPPFLDLSNDVLSVRTSAKKWNVASRYGPCSELFFLLRKKEPNV